jgi:uncharacterized protein YwgA
MRNEGYQWLAALVAHHSNGELVGRTRLQKEIKLLQRIGWPTEYEFQMYYYGPYSESVQADVNLLIQFGFLKEEVRHSQDGWPYSIFTAKHVDGLPDVSSYGECIDLFANTDTTVLELAATYDAFIEMGMPECDALIALRKKKGKKCEGGREQEALKLLSEIGLEFRG